MTKFTYEWFISESREAQTSLEKWPEPMKNNIAVAAANLPTLRENQASLESTKPQETSTEHSSLE